MFSDRIEFYNPGGLPKDITPENITEKQYSWNPILVKTLGRVRYIEELGEGWNKIIKEHNEHVLKPKVPIIKTDKFTTLIALYSTAQKFKEGKYVKLNERQKKALEYTKENGTITNQEYRKLFPEISDRTVLNDLNDMVSKEILEKMGKTKSSYYIIPK